MAHRSWTPRARTQHLVVQPLEGQVVVYDMRSHHAYCLSAAAATVFQLCDGTRTVDMIATEAALAPVASAHDVIDELLRLDLLASDPRLLRRQAMVAPLAAGTFIASMLVPHAAFASSCAGALAACSTRACCPGLTCILRMVGLPTCG